MFTLRHLSDDTLLADLAALVATDRQTTAALLAHLAEVEHRQLHLRAACSSMFVYATRVLGFSEDAALKRIRAARVARRFPMVFDAIADGRMHVSGVVMLAPHVTEGNVEEVLAAAAHRTKAELEELVARLAPKPDLPTSITRIDPEGSAGPAGAAGQLALEPSPEELALEPPPEGLAPEPPPGGLALEPPPAPPVRDATRARVLAPGRYALRVTIGQETHDKLVRAQALLRHRNPGGELAEVIDRALGALLEVLEKEKFGKTSRPRAAKARGEDADARYVPREVRRAVHARDGEQCAFVSDDGARCTERAFLELDHRTAVALGGKPTVDGTRILCHAHNQYEAERQLGADFVRAKRESRRKRRVDAAVPGRVDTPPTSDVAVRAGAEDAAVPAVVERQRTGDDAEECAARPHADPEGAVGREGAVELEREITLAMRGMGFGARETSHAMADSAPAGATTFEARLRAALASWRTAHGSRCSEGPFDEAARQLAMFLAGKALSEAASGRGPRHQLASVRPRRPAAIRRATAAPAATHQGGSGAMGALAGCSFHWLATPSPPSSLARIPT